MVTHSDAVSLFFEDMHISAAASPAAVSMCDQAVAEMLLPGRVLQTTLLCMYTVAGLKCTMLMHMHPLATSC
jgi:hypothetical protein